MHNYGEIHQKNWIVGAIPCGRPTFDNESQPWPGLATVSTVEKLMTSQNQFLGLTDKSLPWQRLSEQAIVGKTCNVLATVAEPMLTNS